MFPQPRAATAAAAAVFLALVPASAVRAQEPAPLPAPSHGRLLLAVSDTADGWMRGVLLTCPATGGHHPRAAEACADLDRAGGEMRLLSGREGPCTAQYAPVTARVSGTWRGRAVDWRETFANACVLRARTGAVFAF